MAGYVCLEMGFCDVCVVARKLASWPPNASFYASSTCCYLRLLSSLFDQGFTVFFFSYLIQLRESRKIHYLTREFCVKLHLLYLIVPFWYASAAYQASLVEPWFVIPMARPNEPDMPPKRTKKARLGIYRTQIRM